MATAITLNPHETVFETATLQVLLKLSHHEARQVRIPFGHLRQQ
jgi:hypothetical protein